jgi:hypothetical protein
MSVQDEQSDCKDYGESDESENEFAKYWLIRLLINFSNVSPTINCYQLTRYLFDINSITRELLENSRVKYETSISYRHRVDFEKKNRSRIELEFEIRE